MSSRRNRSTVCLFIFVWWILVLIIAGPSQAQQKDTQAIRLVQEYGKNIGGTETIESLVGLVMITMKPNSEVGINILGWYAVMTEKNKYRVFFAYIERELQKWSWEVELPEKRVVPLDSMASGLCRMAEVL